MQPSSILILADESANWQIAGLRQLDRLVLAINESVATKTRVFIFWEPETASEQGWIPKDSRLANCELHLTSVAIQGAPVLSTRLLLKRGVRPEFSLIARDENWENLSAAFVDMLRNSEPTLVGAQWRYVTARKQIPSAERWFLRDTGKPQDGFVARLVNRPISRAISQFLLRTPLTPTAWTLSIFPVALLGFVMLLRGDWAGFLSGAALFQLFSILDGCDGEMARAKYLESDRGRRLDTLSDVMGSILFALGLGLGLQRFAGLYYAAEGIVCALLIAANEWLLASLENRRGDSSKILGDTLYSRHRAMVERAGLLAWGEKPLWWLFQLTKRDVAILFFVFLALIGRVSWALRLWTGVAAISLLLALRGSRAGS